jgi:hypothetical protein
MHETCAALLQVYSLPLVGVWLSGVGGLTHPLVAAAVLKFCFSSVLPDKVTEADGSFLVVLGNGEHVCMLAGCMRAARYMPQVVEMCVLLCGVQGHHAKEHMTQKQCLWSFVMCLHKVGH